MVAFIASHQDLEDLLRQESLVDKDATTLPELSFYPPNIYMGIGICNQHALTEGLPVDVFAMLLIAEKLGNNKYVLIADAHAQTNGFTKDKVQEKADRLESTLNCALKGLSQWTIIRASALGQDFAYKQLMSSIEHPNDYIRMQTADALWFHQQRNVTVKLGWRLNGNKQTDEKGFDRYVDLPEFGFVYVECGKTFDPTHLRAPPYFTHDASSRILLDCAEDPGVKIRNAIARYGNEAVHPYLNFLKKVVRLYEKVIEPLPRGPIAEKLRCIIERRE